MHSGVIKTFAKPVARSASAPMEVHTSPSCSACTSPANMVNGSRMPSTASTRPAMSAFATGRSPIFPAARSNRPSNTQKSHPAAAPTNASGKSQASSAVPTWMSVKRGSDMPPPNSAPSPMNAASAPAMAQKYTTIFEFFGSVMVAAPLGPSPPSPPSFPSP